MKQLLAQGLQDLGITADQTQLDKLLTFTDMLLEKNKVMNLTGAKTAEEVICRHILDSAAALQLMKPQGKRVLDIGSGAGFPGMPLAILYPDAQLTLLDSLGKRVVFLQECLSALAITNAQAVHKRAEELLPRACFDLVTSRAVADLRVLAELSLPMARLGGYIAPIKGKACDEELAAAQNAIKLLGGTVKATRQYQIPQADFYARVILIKKIKPTPKKYPRRFAQISASPL